MGTGLAAASYAAFAIHDALVKLSVARLPVWEVLFARSLVIVVVCLALGRRRLAIRAATTPARGALALRAGVTLAAWLCYYTASRSLPLGQLTTLYFAAPVMVTAMAAPLLGELVSPARWAAVAVGFLGVIVASDPGAFLQARSDLVATALALAAAAFWAYGIILMRRIARRETSLLQMLFGNSAFTLITGLMCLFSWETPDRREVIMMAAIGACGAVGQFLLFEAASRIPAAVAAVVEYTGLIWAFTLGFMIWRDVPDLVVFLGAALILMASSALFVVERRSRH